MYLDNMTDVSIATHASEILKRCDQLALCTESDGIIHRTFLSKPTHQAYQLVENYMKAAGMKVRVDGMGNVIGRLTSKNAQAKTLCFGSHLDTIPNAGKYDGILGVLLPISLIESLPSADLPFHIDIIGFSEEEGVRFNTPYLGSKALIDDLPRSVLATKDKDGKSVSDACREFGLEAETIYSEPYDIENVSAFIEVHIEQGPLLESKNEALATVESIAGQLRQRVRFTGMAGHAGTTPMHLRQDPLMAMAEFAHSLESYAKEHAGLVATIGMATAHPGAGNVIPGHVTFSLDVRHGRQQALDDAIVYIEKSQKEICAKRNIRVDVERSEKQDVVACNEKLTAMLHHTCQENRHPLKVTSGAGHDAVYLAKKTAMTMLFIRSPGGISHNPLESVIAEDVEKALVVLQSFIKEFSDKKGIL